MSARIPSTPRRSATRCTKSWCTTRPESGSSNSWSNPPSSDSPRSRSAARSTSSRTTPTLPATRTDVTRTTARAATTTSAAYAEVLIPFFVSRQIYTGAGKVLQTARGATYSIAQRAEHIWEGVSSATTRSRPIINTRDEPHADAEKYRRLHVIVGDSNMSEYTTFLKVGAAACMLRMLEDPNVVLRDMTLENPDPGDPRDQPRHHLPADGPARQRSRGQRARHPARVPRSGTPLRRRARGSHRSSRRRWRCGSTASPPSRTTR